MIIPNHPGPSALDLVVGAVSGRDAGSALAGLLGLVGWFGGSLLVAVLTIWEA